MHLVQLISRECSIIRLQKCSLIADQLYDKPLELTDFDRWSIFWPESFHELASAYVAPRIDLAHNW